MNICKRLLGGALSATLLLTVVPIALADDTLLDPTTSTSTERIEAEDYLKNLSTTDATVTTESGHSGDGFLNNTKNGHVICLGEADLTGLQTVEMCLANPRTTVTFDFYMDGVDDSRHIASLHTAKTSDNAADWFTYQTFSAAVLPRISAVQLAGRHTLYMTVTSVGSGGNIDYVDLIKTLPETVEEKAVEKQFAADIDLSLSTGNITKPANIDNQLIVDGVRVIGSLQTNFVLAYTDISLTGLQAMAFDYAPSSGLKVEVYAGDTMDTAVKIAAPTLNTALNAGVTQWYGADNYRSSGRFSLTLGADMPETTNLFFKIAADRGNFRTFTLHYACDEVLIKTEKPIGFSDAIDLNLSVGVTSNAKQDANGEPIIGGLAVGNVLAYPNMSLDKLTGIRLNYAPSNTGSLSVKISYGDTAATATDIATLPLDNALTQQVQNDTTVPSGSKWWNYQNYRDSEVAPLSLPENAPRATTLFFTLLGTRCNFKTFTLCYEEDISGAWQYEAEDYVWGASKATPNWLRSAAPTQVESPQNGDIFYLGKADLTNLTDITARITLPTSYNAAGTYTFYADMDVPYASLTDTSQGYNRDRYQYTADAPLSGGVELGKMDIKGFGADWNTYAHFYTAVDTSLLSAGEHRLYMKVDTTKGNALGNIDCFCFGGLEKGSIDTTFDWPQSALAVSFVGRFEEEVYAASVTSAAELKTLLETVKAPALGGYTFCGWNENDADAIFDANKNNDTPYVISPIYSVGDNAGQRLQYTVTTGADIQPVDASMNLTSIFFDDRVDLKLADGVTGSVAYWELDGQKMAYGQNRFTFYVTGNNTVSVTLAQEGETYTPEASVNLQQYSTQHNALSNTYVLSVIAQTYVPTGSATEYGVYYAPSAAVLEAIQNGTAAAGSYVQVVSSKAGNNQQYMTHLLGVKAGKARYAMAYAVIDGETVYSPVAFHFTTPADGDTVTVETVSLTKEA